MMTLEKLIQLAKTELAIYYTKSGCRMTADEEIEFLVAKLNQYVYNRNS